MSKESKLLIVLRHLERVPGTEEITDADKEWGNTASQVIKEITNGYNYPLSVASDKLRTHNTLSALQRRFNTFSMPRLSASVEDWQKIDWNNWGFNEFKQKYNDYDLVSRELTHIHADAYEYITRITPTSGYGLAITHDSRIEAACARLTDRDMPYNKLKHGEGIVFYVPKCYSKPVLEPIFYFSRNGVIQI